MKMSLCDITVRTLDVRGGGNLGRLLMEIKDDSKGCLTKCCPHRTLLAKKKLLWEECGDRRSMGDDQCAVCIYRGKVPVGVKDT